MIFQEGDLSKSAENSLRSTWSRKRECTHVIKNGSPVILPHIIYLVVFDADSPKRFFWVRILIRDLVRKLARAGRV